MKPIISCITLELILKLLPNIFFRVFEFLYNKNGETTNSVLCTVVVIYKLDWFKKHLPRKD